MSAFQQYMLYQAKARAAKNLSNYAGVALDNARVMERLAEIDSQHEPIASLLEEKMSERERLYAIAFYVAVGRMPERSESDG